MRWFMPILVGGVGILLVIAGCNFVTDVSPADSGGPSGSGLAFRTVVAGANYPIAMAVAPDGRVFYTEKETGLVRVIDASGRLLAAPFADVPVVSNSERGLLGIALDPSFAQNGYVYVFYTRSSTGGDTTTSSAAQDNRVVRFTAAGNVAAGAEQVIIVLPAAPGSNHNGGNLHFGPDGKLYITIGELTDITNSQTVSTLAGKILRINPDGSIPADNPFGVGNATFALGLRNSFDFAFDAVSGVIFATENGTFRHDEVNRLPAGANGGWPLVEGKAGGTGVPVQFGSYVEPIVETAGIVVPTGIDFAPSDLLGAGFQNQMFVAEYQTGRIIRYTLDASRIAVSGQAVFAQGIPGGMTDIAFAPDGSLYVATSETILQITPGSS